MRTLLQPLSLFLLVFQIALLPLNPPPYLPPPAVSICLDRRDDCPRLPRRTVLLLPDLQTLPPAEFHLLVDEAGEHRAVRFSNAVVNLGPGAIEVFGELPAGVAMDDHHRVQIQQKIFRPNGSFVSQEIGALEFHPEHSHWHWDGFSVYEVWSVAADGELGRRVAVSGKVGYCFRDNATLAEAGHGDIPLKTENPPADAAYRSCSWQRQGISAGWTDIYDYKTPGQIVDLGDAPDGVYALKSVVDPDGRLAEIDRKNNTAIAYFALDGRKLEFYGEELPESR